MPYGFAIHFIVFLTASLLSSERKQFMLRNIRWTISLSVCLCVRKVYCGTTADWIRMPFGVVSGVGRGMGISDGVVIVEGEGQFCG